VLQDVEIVRLGRSAVGIRRILIIIVFIIHVLSATLRADTARKGPARAGLILNRKSFVAAGRGSG